MKNFIPALTISAMAAFVGYWYAGWKGLIITLILGALEVSISFDNAVVNAKILGGMQPKWQKLFLTVGFIFATFGTRLLFPLLIVWITAGINPAQGLYLATHPPADPQQSYAHLVQLAHPQIAAFGGMFLLTLFFDFMMEDKPISWIHYLERPLIRLGRLRVLQIVAPLTILLGVTYIFGRAPQREQILTAGIIGVIVYTIIDAIGAMFPSRPPSGQQGKKKAALAGFMGFIYLELIDASFSLDGVVGAFAITSDPLLIMLGLGFIGSICVRAITMYFVRSGTLGRYIYVEHGAHWAIGVLAVILLITVGTMEIPEVITGGIGIIIIALSVLSSVRYNQNHQKN